MAAPLAASTVIIAGLIWIVVALLLSLGISTALTWEPTTSDSGEGEV
jgi:hypothetical protein